MYFKVIISIIDGELMCNCGKLKLVVESIFAMVTLFKMCLIELVTILEEFSWYFESIFVFQIYSIHDDIY